MSQLLNHFAALLDALLFTPSRNGKLRLMREYFASGARPGTGLGVGGADRRARLRRGQAEPGARPRHRPRRSRAARLVLRFCRRSRRDGVVDLARRAGWRRPRPEPLRDRRAAERGEPQRGPAAARAVARRARRDRALGVAEARHPRAADRRLGAARQDRARRVERCRARPHRGESGMGSRRPTSRCSIGSRAADRRPRSAICRPLRR